MAEVFVDLLAPFSLPRLPTTSVVASAGPALALIHMRQDHIEEAREPFRDDLHTATILRVLTWRGP